MHRSRAVRSACILTLLLAAAPASAEMHIGCSATGQLRAHVDFAQPLPLEASVFPGINGFATGLQGFHSVEADEPDEDIFGLHPMADIRAILVSVGDGMRVYNNNVSMLIGQQMQFGEIPFDYHPIFQIFSGGALPGQTQSIGLVFHDQSGHHTDSDPAIITFTPAGCPADLGRQGGIPGSDGLLDNNDFIIFINDFFAHAPAADVGLQGGTWGSDGFFDNNDFVSYITLFFAGGVCG